MNDFFTAGSITAGYGRQIILNGLDLHCQTVRLQVFSDLTDAASQLS